ncbi:hypothetical protein [Sphingobacterium corticibacterium]|uniref:Uncharacterized protein n=1 Tax=Sphingobacterium corticibacterium TaxID=2484746 RepID=A0A4Q6XDJ1_9SPHI|nr:hypothetical protein [Sphingobacterium corticibacterium]RZF57489.1 hypothetical protein EWE74_20945 [Sphingobacterium corticibacterium]
MTLVRYVEKYSCYFFFHYSAETPTFLPFGFFRRGETAVLLLSTAFWGIIHPHTAYLFRDHGAVYQGSIDAFHKPK